MHSTLHKWFLISLLFVLLTIPFSASAQGQVALDSVTVQLWPEFDQPAMLVIYDFTLTKDTSLPVDVTIRIPTDATVIAVAYASADGLFNVPYQEPVKADGWQEITLTVDMETTYHIEYYAPLNRSDLQRDYLYVWPGDYSVETFNLSVKAPVDTTEITTDPQMNDITTADSTQTLLSWGTSGLEAGKQLPIKVTYIKTSERLSASDQPLETGVVDENTQGRVSLSNYLPYILGGLGVLLIVAGGLYFWQSSKGNPEPRKRHRSRDEDSSDGGDAYCHQCGKRAQSSDRFCRTCGTRLRKET